MQHAVAGQNQSFHKGIPAGEASVKIGFLLKGKFNEVTLGFFVQLGGLSAFVHGEFDGLGMNFFLLLQPK